MITTGFQLRTFNEEGDTQYVARHCIPEEKPN